MTRLCTLDGSIEVTSIGNAVVLDVEVETVQPGAFVIDFLVTGEAFIAAAQRDSRLGVRAIVGIGGGVSVTVPEHELARSMVIDESTQGYGDRLEMQFAGERFSPYARDWLAARNKIEVFLKYGATALTEFSGLVFTGHILSSSFSDPPPTGSIVALDGAALYAMKKAKDYILPANSGKTRLEIFTEVCAAGGIPVRSSDFGPDGGGVYSKPFACGDRVILDVMRDFLAVIGVEIGFIENQLVAVRYDPNAASVAELNPSNVIAPSSLVPPDTIAPNVLGVVSVATTSTDPSGYRVEELLRIVTAEYAPATYETKLTNGVPTENPIGSVASVQTISEVATKTTYYGTLEIRTEEREKAWYAPRDAKDKVSPGIDSGDVVIEPVSGTVYVYPDGSTRSEFREQFRETRSMVRVKDLNDAKYVVRVNEERTFFRSFRQRIFDVTAGIDEVAQNDIPLADDGQGLLEPSPEGIGRYGPDEITVVDFDVNDDGTINEERMTEYFYSIGATVRRSDGTSGYGIDNTTYSNRSLEVVQTPLFPPVTDATLANWRALRYGGVRVTTKRYRAIDEDSYEAVTTVREGSATPTVTTERFLGSLPRAERAEPEVTSQEIRATIEDRQRIAFAGGEQIEDIEHNEYIQNSAEAQAYALIRARKASARVLSCDMPIEALIHKWRMVTVRLPGSSIDGLRFWVTGVRRDVGAFRESVTAERYAPLLL